MLFLVISLTGVTITGTFTLPLSTILSGLTIFVISFSGFLCNADSHLSSRFCQRSDHFPHIDRLFALGEIFGYSRDRRQPLATKGCLSPSNPSFFQCSYDPTGEPVIVANEGINFIPVFGGEPPVRYS